MRAIGLGCSRQRLQTVQRPQHLIEHAFNHPPAAHRKNGIAAEQAVRFLEPISDMTERMSGDVEDLRRRVAELIGVAIFQFDIDPGNPLSAGMGADNRASGLFLKL